MLNTAGSLGPSSLSFQVFEEFLVSNSGPFEAIIKLIILSLQAGRADCWKFVMNYLNNPFVMRSVPDIAINRNKSYRAPRRGGEYYIPSTAMYKNGLPS